LLLLYYLSIISKFRQLCYMLQASLIIFGYREKVRGFFDIFRVGGILF